MRNDQFGVSELALRMGMSRSTLHRKITSITNLTVSQFIRRIRLKRALELLRNSTLSISEVARECGFHSLSYFTKCFNDYYGTSPSKYNNAEVPEDFLHIPGNPKDRKKFISVKAILLWITMPLLIIVTTVLLILFYKPVISTSNLKQNSIAVLHLSDNDPDRENAYLVNGVLIRIRQELSLLEDLNVVTRVSVENYLNTGKSNEEIGKELNVNYILEGKSQVIQGNTRIDLQLVDVSNNENLWSKPIVTDLRIENSYEVQKEVVLAVINNLKAKHALKEKEQNKQNLTENIAAYNLYMIGNNFLTIHKQSLNKNISLEAVGKAKESFEKTIELDSTFSEAYALLGSIYINHLYKMASGGDFEIARNLLDSGLVMLNKALFYDPENVIALQKKAEYYEKIGSPQEASQLYEELSNLGELSYQYYENEVMQFPKIKNHYRVLESYLKYLITKPEEIPVSSYMLRKIVAVLMETGFPELEKQMAEKLFEFSIDSARYYRYMFSAEMYQKNFDTARYLAMEGNHLDPTSHIFTDLIALSYAYQEEYKKALNYISLVEDTVEEWEPVVRPGYIPGYIHLMNGNEKEANYHFKREITRRLKEIEYARPQARQCESQLYLSATYLALGDEGKALEYLKELKSLRSIDYGHIIMITRWPGFESIRNTTEYLDVLKDLQNKYLHQHQQIGELIENADLDPSLN